MPTGGCYLLGVCRAVEKRREQKHQKSPDLFEGAIASMRRTHRPGRLYTKSQGMQGIRGTAGPPGRKKGGLGQKEAWPEKGLAPAINNRAERGDQQAPRSSGAPPHPSTRQTGAALVHRRGCRPPAPTNTDPAATRNNSQQLSTTRGGSRRCRQRQAHATHSEEPQNNTRHRTALTSHTPHTPANLEQAHTGGPVYKPHHPAHTPARSAIPHSKIRRGAALGRPGPVRGRRQHKR